MQITAFEYDEIKDQVITIDVRTKKEYKFLDKIDNSINIELGDLIRDYEQILSQVNPDSKLIVTVCNAGNRSSEAANFLKEKGYNAKVLLGGIYRYKK